jgi:hypothetical protein
LASGNIAQSPREHRKPEGRGKAIRYKKKRRSDGPTAGATLSSEKRKFLANPSAIEAPVASHANPATAEQIGDGRDRFLGVLGTGTHRENEFAE